MRLARIQVENGLYFLFEHPAHATSWSRDCVKQVLGLPGVIRVEGHMCEFDMRQVDQCGEGLVKKLTGFMTNSELIAEELSKRCSGMHRHITLIGGRAKAAQVYPEKLCKAIVVG